MANFFVKAKNDVKNLEKAYLKVYEINSKNLKPEDIFINQ